MSGLERTQSDIEEAARQNSTCRSVYNIDLMKLERTAYHDGDIDEQVGRDAVLCFLHLPGGGAGDKPGEGEVRQPGGALLKSGQKLPLPTVANLQTIFGVE